MGIKAFFNTIPVIFAHVALADSSYHIVKDFCILRQKKL
jgi:hypothetical protein